MKKIIYIFALVAIGLTACKGIEVPYIPECTWSNNASISFQKIDLTIPKSHSFWGMSTKNLISFPEVFNFFGGVENKSSIVVTTSVVGCAGTASKFIQYGSMYDKGLLHSGFANQNRVIAVNEASHTVVIEITTGPWQSQNTGETGTIVWTHRLGGGSQVFNLHSSLMAGEGTFKAIQSNAPQSIYIGSEFVERELF